MDTTTLFEILIVGAAGGLGYDYYYKLLSMSTWMSAAGHVAAGAFAAAVTVLSGTLVAPTSYASIIALAAVGYAGTDFIDSLVQKLRQTPATSASSPSTPGPPAAPGS
jgi:hypothetical protein